MNTLTIAMMVLFLQACSWEGHIFGGIRKYIPPVGKWYKPLYGCAICMTPWYGSVFYWIFFHISWQDWITTVAAAAGINVISVCLITIRECAVQVKKKCEGKDCKDLNNGSAL